MSIRPPTEHAEEDTGNEEAKGVMSRRKKGTLLCVPFSLHEKCGRVAEQRVDFFLCCGDRSDFGGDCPLCGCVGSVLKRVCVVCVDRERACAQASCVVWAGCMNCGSGRDINSGASIEWRTRSVRCRVS